MDANDMTEEITETSQTELPDDDIADEGGGEDEIPSVNKKLDELKALFERKIAEDTHLRELNNKLYTDLKKYQDGFIDRMIESIYSEIILIINDIESQVSHIPKEVTEDNYNKLFDKFSGIPLRLLDLLYEHDVEPYREPTDDFIPKRQEVASVVNTEDPSLRNKVKESVSKGYFRRIISDDGDSLKKVLRKEKVVVYKYEENKNE